MQASKFQENIPCEERVWLVAEIFHRRVREKNQHQQNIESINHPESGNSRTSRTGFVARVFGEMELEKTRMEFTKGS
eukprot:507153-Hanusia_phi.AAC.1